ncbi:VWA domain-containing protein [Nostoc sp. CCY0012]|uniref:VWA domain-containing protein n=1 Tax=Nostoc sp. CCY0012 TaxID=1056123 RepID=UPI0039C6EFE0
MSIFQFGHALAQTAKGGIDWIVVVDTSASMRGAGGTKNIFTQVKNSITEFVNTARVGDTVTIYSFDSDINLQAQEVTIASNPDRGKLKQIINDLKADGLRTHTGKAVQKALQASARLNQRTDAVNRIVSIVFLTDGLEDVKGIANPVRIPQSTQLLREQQCKPYVFFVSLGQQEHEQQLNEFANNPALCGKGRVLRDPGGVQLNKLAQTIRPVLIKPQLDVSLSTTDLPPLLPGITTELIKVTSNSNINTQVNLQLEDINKTGIRLVSPKKIDLTANQKIVIPVNLQIPSNSPGGNRKLRLILTATDKSIAPQAIDVSVTIKPQLSLQPKNLSFGDGELELLEPLPTSPEEQFISLTHQHKQKVSLSAIVPAIASTNDDAELVIMWQSGKKYVYIRSIKSVLFVNNEKITTTQLYDEDTIQIGNVKLRFNWIGNQRPYEQNTGLANF